MQGRLWLALVATLLAGAACSGDKAAGEGVLVFAAASLTDVFEEMEEAFESANPGIDARLNFAGSSALREQILQGAPADVFASANESTMSQLAQAGELQGAPKDFARNRVQIAVPSGNPGQVRRLEDFSRPELLIGLCAQGVPCGDLARQALSTAGVEASVDTNEPSVRALLVKISEDELDAGIVYVTDVLAAKGAVQGIGVALDGAAATYPIAQLAQAPNPEGAAAFVQFVLSNQGQAIMSEYGFVVS